VGTVDERTNMDTELSSLSSSVDHSQQGGEASGHAKRVSQKRAAPMSSSVQALLLGTRATDIFFTVCAEELSVLNTRLNHLPARDYSDVFNEISKMLHEPFSFRLMEINSKCAAVFQSLDLLPAEMEQIFVQFDQFLKEKIYVNF
uniref:DH domain-containing protein n=1 Tax=Globodera pallida TaxID=36090 RepID=A0A183CRU7_GLOPA